MTITDFKIYRYRLPLKTPLALKGVTLKEREGLVVEIATENGQRGYGEAAPLPEFSRENLAKAETALQKLRRVLPGQAIPSGLEKLNGGFDRWLGPFALPPSASFGVEMAVLSLVAQRKKVSLAALINPDAPAVVSVNGFLSGSREEIVRQAEEMLKAGFRSFKLKVGTEAFAEDVARVKSVSDVLRGKALLRLDGNKSWPLPQAVDFFNQVGMDVVEYIEEPLAKTEELPTFYHESSLPIALDESVRQDGLRPFRSLDGVEVVVIKPMLSGGVEKTKALADEARQAGLEVVLSSSFESGLSVLALAHLAAAFSRHVAVGLDTLRYFENDILVHSPDSTDGRIHLTAVPLTAADFRHDVLVEIPAA